MTDSSRQRGAVACGHPETAHTAAEVLRAGGNAFDAAVAAFFTACVVEPVLASLGGGGFLLARGADGTARLYDFFVHTPGTPRPPGEQDFHPITADFGTAHQVFHVGLGSVAVPGAVAGMCTVQRDLCRLPLARLLEPAIAQARAGVPLNPFQGYILDIVRPIYTLDPEVRATLAVADGETLRQPDLADTLERLGRDGADGFYRGDFAHALARRCAEGGGHSTLADLAGYRTRVRQPLTVDFAGRRLVTNPPPSSGGILIAFALRLLGDAVEHARGDRLVQAMALTNAARIDAALDGTGQDDPHRVLDPDFLQRYRDQVRGHPTALRGTTHISVADAAGNLASLTVSNGEGCGHMVPGSGVVLNNMLGEEDLNPGGFHRWPPATRMTSMMAPSVLHLADGGDVVLGSGGSNRIRTALLQVILDLARGQTLHDAVAAPRLHFENDLLSIEPGFPPALLEELAGVWPQRQHWRDRNLFFGGVHAVQRRGRRFSGAGDPRRGGVAVVL